MVGANKAPLCAGAAAAKQRAKWTGVWPPGPPRGWEFPPIVTTVSEASVSPSPVPGPAGAPRTLAAVKDHFLPSRKFPSQDSHKHMVMLMVRQSCWDNGKWVI